MLLETLQETVADAGDEQKEEKLDVAVVEHEEMISFFVLFHFSKVKLSKVKLSKIK